MAKAGNPRIYVLAGTNGAGKSSIGGAIFRENGADYFNPDEAASAIRRANPHISESESQSLAWHQGKRLLLQAIAERLDFAFETTLGGNTITALLEKGAESGMEVLVWYVGLAAPELHIARVRARAARGGHNIPEAKIRERFTRSIMNLIRLMPGLTELRLYDNSHEADPHERLAPLPLLLLHLQKGKVAETCPLASVPRWAKPILMAAMNLAVK